MFRDEGITASALANQGRSLAETKVQFFREEDRPYATRYRNNELTSDSVEEDMVERQTFHLSLTWTMVSLVEVFRLRHETN